MRIIRAIVGVGWLILIISCTSESLSIPESLPPTPSIPSLPSSSPTINKLGLHLLLTDGHHDWPLEIWSSHLAQAREAVGEWGYVVELVRLDDLDSSRWQHFIDLCTELHLTPVLRLATTHDEIFGGWTAPPRDQDGTYRTIAAQYTDFIVSLDWPLTSHYIIVGNEPNHGNEWGGRPDPAAYARFLIDVADTLHAADPQAQILNAGFDFYTPHTGDQPFINGQYYMDAESFMDQMVIAHPDVFTRLDVWASHSYPMGPFIAPPWQQSYGVDWLNGVTNPHHIKPPPQIFNRGINGYEWELYKLSTYGLDPLPVIITETGWRHAEAVDPDSPDNSRPLPDMVTVAQYIDLALYGNDGNYPDLPQEGWTPWLVDERVIGIVFFALDGHPSFWGHTNWLILDERGQVIDHYAPFDQLKNRHENK